jgi:PAS domain S-box-containing protein
MNASLDPERVLELIAESVIDVAGCHKAAIYLLEQETPDPSLLLTHAQGFSPEHIVRSKDIAVPLTDDERRLVIDEGTPVAVPNLRDNPVDVSPLALLLARQEDFNAYVYLPLRAQKQPIGMLAVYYDQPHHFSSGEIELLETFANQAALAVVNARIYQRVDVQLARRVEQIVHMADINQRLTSTLNLETVFGLIIDSAMEGCEADRGVLVLVGDPELEQETEGLNMVAWRGFNPERSVRMPHHVAEELVDSKVLKDGETLLASQDDLGTSGPRSQLSLPIILEERVIGAIALESESLNAFSGEDVTFVSQLAVQASVAIRNAQLYKRAQRVRDRLEAILDASNDGLLMIDHKSRIVMTNSKMGEFWDFARADYRPRSPDEFLADPLTALGEGLGYREGELSELMVKSVRSPTTKFGTDLYVTRSGGTQRQRFVERSVAPVRDDDNNFLGLLLIFRDVTKQKELEQAREDLTSMIVHDLRSPLQAVMGSMRLIGESVPDQNPIVEQATSVSTRAVKKLLNLVNNLLDLSRLERGEFVLDPSVESVRAILEDAAQELLPLAQEMDAVVRVEASDNLPESNVDRDMIERVTLNLVDNALKYSPPGTLVTLKAEVVDASTLKRGARKEPVIRVQVIDTGPGIPDEYKETIFDRYSQVPGQKGRRASAGLGLAFCRLAIESHGGAIWVENNPGPKGGSIFAFTLPVSRAPARADDKALEKRVAARKPAPKPKAGPASPPQLTGGPKAADGKSAEDKATGDKPAGAKPPEGQPAEAKPSDASAKGSAAKAAQPESSPAPSPTNGKKPVPPGGPPGDGSPGT